MDYFHRPPLSVYTKKVGFNATYTDATLWLYSDDPTAVQAIKRVKEDNCVLFLQIGGTSEVMCATPNADAPQGVFISTRPTQKKRGKRGQALMMFYQ